MTTSPEDEADYLVSCLRAGKSSTRKQARLAIVDLIRSQRSTATRAALLHGQVGALQRQVAELEAELREGRATP
jgi:hypothetical protein